MSDKSNHTAVKTSKKRKHGNKNVRNKEDLSVEGSERKRTAAC